MTKPIKQMKGKELKKLPKSTQPKLDDYFFVSKKYDGRYVQIVVDEDILGFFSSGGKYFEFIMDEELHKVHEDFVNNFGVGSILEAELIYKEGKREHRNKTAIMTTWVTNTSKGISNKLEASHKFMIFNWVRLDLEFRAYKSMLESIQYNNFLGVTQHFLEFDKAILLIEEWIHDGYEGGMLRKPNSVYHIGKRVNDLIKYKGTDKEGVAKVLECIEGQGKYAEMIGSLNCITDSGVKFNIGSGLTDAQRAMPPEHFIGKFIEYEYDQLSVDGVPLEPIFKRRVGDE